MIDFKALDLEDKEIITGFFSEDPQQTSEFTFTNLFIWRRRYSPSWLQWKNCLLLTLQTKDQALCGLPPVGRGDKGEALSFLEDYLLQTSGRCCIQRVPENFIERFMRPQDHEIRLDFDNSDYVYLTEDLIRLSGRKYHRKKNHLNRFLKTYRYKYRFLDRDLVEEFLNLQETWCQLRNCEENPDLLMEDFAIRQALIHYEELGLSGGAIMIEDRVEAFSLGERLNKDTAVIHIEKANPKINGLYAAINQFFCEQRWAEMKYINREQDLGNEGLRKAKQSYHPHHLEKKYTLTLKS